MACWCDHCDGVNRRERSSSWRNKLVRDVSARKPTDNNVLLSSVVPRKNVVLDWNVNDSWSWNVSGR